MLLHLGGIDALALNVVIELQLDGAQPAHRARNRIVRSAAEEVGTLVCAELLRLLPSASLAGVAFLGARFSFTELLRPGFAIHARLAEQYRRGLRDGTPQLLFIGEVDGKLPDTRFTPSTSDDLLSAFPLVLVAAEGRLDALASAAEAELVERGALAPPSLAALSGWLDHPLSHGALMTMLDVLAVHVEQLRQIGLSDAAQILEAALLRPTAEASHGRWRWDGQRVLGQLQGFAADRESASVEVLQFRQSAALLAAHGLTVVIYGAVDGVVVEWLKTPESLPPTTFVEVSSPSLGVLWWSAVDEHAREYVRAHPSGPQAVATLEESLQRALASAGRSLGVSPSAGER